MEKSWKVILGGSMYWDYQLIAYKVYSQTLQHIVFVDLN